MSFDERELVPLAKSFFSTSAADNPREAASSAIPAPVIPPPITAMSNVRKRIRSRFASLVRAESSGSLGWNASIESEVDFIVFVQKNYPSSIITTQFMTLPSVEQRYD